MNPRRAWVIVVVLGGAAFLWVGMRYSREVRSEQSATAAAPTGEALALRFFKNPAFTLTNQTRFIAALHAVKVKGCDDYVAAATESEDERDALFFVESAELLAGLHKTRPVSAILEDSRAMIAKTGGGRAVALFPFDYVRWTEGLAESSLELAARARHELRARSLEARISGTATPAARAGLAAAGWKVVEGMTQGLLTQPAD